MLVRIYNYLPPPEEINSQLYIVNTTIVMFGVQVYFYIIVKLVFMCALCV